MDRCPLGERRGGTRKKTNRAPHAALGSQNPVCLTLLFRDAFVRGGPRRPKSGRLQTRRGDIARAVWFWSLRPHSKSGCEERRRMGMNYSLLAPSRARVAFPRASERCQRHFQNGDPDLETRVGDATFLIRFSCHFVLSALSLLNGSFSLLVCEKPLRPSRRNRDGRVGTPAKPLEL